MRSARVVRRRSASATRACGSARAGPLRAALARSARSAIPRTSSSVPTSRSRSPSGPRRSAARSRRRAAARPRRAASTARGRPRSPRPCPPPAAPRRPTARRARRARRAGQVLEDRARARVGGGLPHALGGQAEQPHRREARPDAVRRGVEHAHRLEHVAEEVEAHGRLRAVREDVHHAAAAGELAGRLDGADAHVPREREVLEERPRRVRLAEREHEAGPLDDDGRRHVLHERAHGRDDHGRERRCRRGRRPRSRRGREARRPRSRDAWRGRGERGRASRAARAASSTATRAERTSGSGGPWPAPWGHVGNDSASSWANVATSRTAASAARASVVTTRIAGARARRPATRRPTAPPWTPPTRTDLFRARRPATGAATRGGVRVGRSRAVGGHERADGTRARGPPAPAPAGRVRWGGRMS